MCQGCYKSYGSPNVRSRKTAQVVRLINKLNNAGQLKGPAFDVVAEWCLDDEAVAEGIQDCLRQDPEDPEDAEEVGRAFVLLTQLLGMTVDERATAMAIYWGYLT